MAAVQFDNGVEFLLAVSAPPADAVTVAAIRRRRFHLRRLARAHQLSGQEVAPVPPAAVEPEDHWDDGARASLAMVGVTYRR
ncbi:MAG TPA: hypothetical protein VG078_04765 [Acidimicrobiales bacterium]|nr:hypothetical protein [Acidimicrobiales bacterium]